MAQGVSGYWPSPSGYSDGYNKIRIYYSQTYTPGDTSSSVYVELQMCDSTVSRTGYLRGTITAAGVTLNSGDQYVSFGSDGNWTKVHSSAKGTGTVSNGGKINFSFSDVKYIRDGSVKTTYGIKSGSVSTTPIPQNSKLTISQCTGSTITVKDSSGNTISNGGTLYPSTTYTVTFGNAVGYNSTSCSVTGLGDISSGSKFTPNGANITVTTTGSKLNTYSLSISAGANSSINVNRTSSNQSGATIGALTTSDTLYYGDKLTIQFAANTGYDVGIHTVNNSSFTSGSSHTVSANVAVVSTATVKSFTLTLNTGTGTTLTVTRTSSPKGGASTGNISSGGKIYYSDVLTITFSASTGYDSVTGSLNSSSITSGSTHTVTGAVIVNTSASVKRFTLTTSAGTGTSILVNRTSSPKQNASVGVLSSGDYIYYSDEITVNFGVDDGYSLATHTVNGTSKATGSSVTVTGATSVVSTAALIEYGLTIVSDAGSSVTVNRTKSPLGKAALGEVGSGGVLYYNDVVTVTFSANKGYNLNTHTLNSVTFTSGTSHTVKADVLVNATSKVKEFSLSINAGEGSSIVVRRTQSPIGEGSIGTLLSGAKLYYNDVLSVTFSANDGYGLSSHTVNGSEFASGGTLTVEVNISVESTASASDFRLTLSIAEGSSIIVERTESPNGHGSIGNIDNGERLYYGDILKITFGVYSSEGYKLLTHTVNDNDFTSGYVYTVRTSVTVATTTEVLSYSLTINKDSGSKVTVTRISSPKGKAETGELTSDSILYFSDEVSILFDAEEGFTVSNSTVNGASFSSGGVLTVSSSLAIICSSEVKSFSLSIASVTGVNIAVERISSPNKGAALTTLKSGDTLYYADVISYSFSAVTGYSISTRTLNGGSVSSSGTYEVYANASFSGTSSVKSFKLSITKDDGCTVTVNRTSSPLKNAATGAVSNGATIYYSDVLNIALSSLTGFEFTSHTVNDSDFTKGNKTVTSNVTIIALTKQMGLVYIEDSEGNSRYQVYINEGTEDSPNYQLYVPYVMTEKGWNLCS